MKKLLFSIVFISSVFTFACGQNFRGLDKSPLDVAYFPDDFAHRRKVDQALVKVYYSRPQLNGRTIFGDLVPYGKVWRTGANENTEITFNQDASINGEQVKAGTYSLFTIPEENQWTLILNSNIDYWGAYSYDQSKDVLRTSIPVKDLNKTVEPFTIQFQPSGDNAVMQIAWDQKVAEAEISFK